MPEGVRVFLIGYEPPGWDFGLLSENPSMQRKLTTLMDGVDVAAVKPDGWPIDVVMDVDGTPFICIAHEHDGKIVIVRPCDAQGGPLRVSALRLD